MAVAFGIFIFDGAEELDWVGPWEVLATWAARFPEDGASVFTLSSATGVTTCAKGLRVLADHALDAAPELDVLVYPGGRGVREHLGSEDIREWLRRLASDGVLMTSVCTGALMLADAGLLDGKPATTHHGAFDDLARLGNGVRVLRDRRVVEADGVITAAGVSAGLDMALALVARFSSREHADDVARTIEYDWRG